MYLPRCFSKKGVCIWKNSIDIYIDGSIGKKKKVLYFYLMAIKLKKKKNYGINDLLGEF